MVHCCVAASCRRVPRLTLSRFSLSAYRSTGINWLLVIAQFPIEWLVARYWDVCSVLPSYPTSTCVRRSLAVATIISPLNMLATQPPDPIALFCVHPVKKCGCRRHQPSVEPSLILLTDRHYLYTRGCMFHWPLHCCPRHTSTLTSPVAVSIMLHSPSPTLYLRHFSKPLFDIFKSRLQTVLFDLVFSH